MLDQIKSLIQDLDEADLDRLRFFVSVEEPKRRLKLEAAQEEQARIVEEVWQKQPDLAPQFAPRPDAVATPETATGTGTPAYPAWVQPTSMWDSYPPAARVHHDGKSWENTLGRLNAGVPGEAKSGWRELTPEPATDTQPPATTPEPTDHGATGTPVATPEASAATPPVTEVDTPATGPRPGAAATH